MDAFAQMVRALEPREPPTLAQRRRERNQRYQESNRQLWRWYDKHVRPISEMVKLFEGAHANP